MKRLIIAAALVLAFAATVQSEVNVFSPEEIKAEIGGFFAPVQYEDFLKSVAEQYSAKAPLKFNNTTVIHSVVYNEKSNALDFIGVTNKTFDTGNFEEIKAQSKDVVNIICGSKITRAFVDSGIEVGIKLQNSSGEDLGRTSTKFCK